MKYTALITILAIVVTFYFSARVGAGRAKLGINAPAMTGNPTFDRIFRVHANTVEQIESLYQDALKDFMRRRSNYFLY